MNHVGFGSSYCKGKPYSQLEAHLTCVVAFRMSGTWPSADRRLRSRILNVYSAIELKADLLFHREQPSCPGPDTGKQRVAWLVWKSVPALAGRRHQCTYVDLTSYDFMLKYHVCLRAHWETNWPKKAGSWVGKRHGVAHFGPSAHYLSSPCFRCAAAPASQVLNMSEIFMRDLNPRGEEHFLGNLYHYWTTHFGPLMSQRPKAATNIWNFPKDPKRIPACSLEKMRVGERIWHDDVVLWNDLGHLSPTITGSQGLWWGWSGSQLFKDQECEAGKKIQRVAGRSSALRTWTMFGMG